MQLSSIGARFRSTSSDPLALSESDDGHEPGRRRAVLRLGTYALILIGAAATLRMISIGVPVLPWVIGVASAGAFLNLAALDRGASIDRAGHVCIGLLFVVLLCSVTATGGFYDPNFAWLFAVPLTAALVVGLRASLGWTGLIAGATWANRSGQGVTGSFTRTRWPELMRDGFAQLAPALVTDGENAWTSSPQEDDKLTNAFQSGRDAVISGTSARGTVTTDTFSLSGFTAAIKSAQDRCK